MDAEARAEALLCARYGELDELRELADAVGGAAAIAAVRDDQGGSALHMAAANGHEDVVAWLLEAGARCEANQSGSSPLHWALMNKQFGCATLLLKSAQGVDVLEHDGTGKTAVTQAYDSNNVDVLKLVLEHPSAARLNKDGSVAPKGSKSDLQREEASDEAADAATSEHEAAKSTDVLAGEAEAEATAQPPLPPHQVLDSVVTLNGESVTVREIGFLQDSAKLAVDDEDLQTTGAFLWAAALVLSQWVAADLRPALAGKRVAELGAGCGLPGLVASVCAGSEAVTVTDLASPTFPNTEHNVQLNQREGRSLSVAALDWCDKSTWPADLVGKTDVVIGSDLVYDLELVAPLVDVVTSLLPASGGTFYYVSADTDRAGCKEFLAALEAAGLVRESQPAPEGFLVNPFSEPRNDKSFAARFPEFASTSFTMYTFTKA